MSLEPKLSGVGAGGATAANQTNGTQRTIQVDSLNNPVPSGTLGDPIVVTGSAPIPVLDLGQIYAGDHVGGVPYTDIDGNPQNSVQLVNGTWVSMGAISTARPDTSEYGAVVLSVRCTFGVCTSFFVRLLGVLNSGEDPGQLLAICDPAAASGLQFQLFPGDFSGGKSVPIRTSHNMGCDEIFVEVKAEGVPAAGDAVQITAKAVPNG